MIEFIHDGATCLVNELCAKITLMLDLKGSTLSGSLLRGDKKAEAKNPRKATKEEFVFDLSQTCSENLLAAASTPR